MINKIKSLKKIFLTLVMSSILVFGGEIPNEQVTENPEREVTTVESLKVRDKAKLSLEVTKIDAEKVIGVLNNGILKIEFSKNSGNSKQNRMFIKPEEMNLRVEASSKEPTKLIQKAGYTSEEIKSMMKSKESSQKNFKVENLEDKYVINVENVDENEKIYLLVTSGKDLVKSYEVETIVDDGPIDLGTIIVSMDSILTKAKKPDTTRAKNLSGVINKYNIGKGIDITTSNGEKESKVFKTENRMRSSRMISDVTLESVKFVKINGEKVISNGNKENFIVSGDKFVSVYDAGKNIERAIEFKKGTKISELANGIELYVPLNHSTLGTDNYKPFEDSYEFVVLGSDGEEYEGRIESKVISNGYEVPDVKKLTIYLESVKPGYRGEWPLDNVYGFSTTVSEGVDSNKIYIISDGNHNLNIPEEITNIKLYTSLTIYDSKGGFISLGRVLGEGILNTDVAIINGISFDNSDKILFFQFDTRNKKYILENKDSLTEYAGIKLESEQEFYVGDLLIYTLYVDVKYVLDSLSGGNATFSYDSRLKILLNNDKWISGNGDIYNNFSSINTVGNYSNFIKIDEKITNLKGKTLKNGNVNGYSGVEEKKQIGNVEYKKYSKENSYAAVPSDNTEIESFMKYLYIYSSGDSSYEYSFETTDNIATTPYSFFLYKDGTQYEKTITEAEMIINGVGKKGTWATNGTGDTDGVAKSGNDLILNVTNGEKLFELASFGGNNVMNLFTVSVNNNGQKVISDTVGQELSQEISLNDDSTSDIKITLGGSTPELKIETLSGVKSVTEGEYQLTIKAYYSPTGTQSNNAVELGEMTLKLNVKNEKPSFSLEGDTFIDFGQMIYDEKYIYHGASKEFKVIKPDASNVKFEVKSEAEMKWTSASSEEQATEAEEETTIKIQDLNIKDIKNNGQEATFRLEGKAVVDKPKKAGMYKGNLDVTVTVEDSTSTRNKK